MIYTNASSILTMTQPEQLFTGDKEVMEKEYRKLAMRWHPDRGGDAKVFAHIGVLYDKAIQRLESGVWNVPGLLRLRAKNGKQYEMRYRKHHQFELGDMYIGDKVVCYVINPEFADLAFDAVVTITQFMFATDTMKSEVQRYLPEFLDGIELDAKAIILLRKESDLLCLADVLSHFGGKLPPEHAAWILSRLYNLKCYLSWAGLVHNDISPLTYFISPQRHSGALLGGWWYSKKSGGKMAALPQRTMRLVPSSVLSDKKAHYSVDSELVRATGREMLGDLVGTKLILDAHLPKTMVDWLRLPGTADAFTEYDTWYNKVLISSFGARRFVNLELTASDIYPS